MIKNEREYKIAKAFVRRFDEGLENLRTLRRKSSHDPEKLKIVEAAHLSKRNDFVHEVREYERLKKGKFDFAALDLVEGLPADLIRARIALGLTQKELARLLGTTEQQVQKYEASDYGTASWTRIMEVVTVLRRANERLS